jgi:aspartyl-tRNA(Asn)/glutamyl-tRNA(Gln) amidotransferase subunit B
MAERQPGTNPAEGLPEAGSRSDFEAVIGLEIHVQLATRTKMFCGCRLSFGDEPNVHTCPVCLGHPGTLPVTNAQAIHYGLQIALALECEIAPRSIFHRKNYFYPDLPKGYQISQYDIPLASSGRLGDVRIHRAHLEEDAAKLIHVGESGRIHGSGASLVDFNRGGTPLVEIVTEPDIRSAAEAREWAQLLRTTLRQLGVSDVNMEEGSLRCDANVSVRPPGSTELGTKTELKNMNSFRFLERGIEAELERQRALIKRGEPVVQETLHFDPSTGGLTPLRSKEEVHDYRYFPEPDLVPLAPTEEMIAVAREAMPELPAAKRDRYRQEMGLEESVASLLAFDASLGEFFERAAAAGDAPAPALANWVTGELVAQMREAGLDGDPLACPAEPAEVAALVAMVQGKQVSHGAAKTVLATMVAEGGQAAEIVERLGLGTLSDTAEIEAIVEHAIEANAEAAAQVRAGNEKAIGRIVGAAMKESNGRADGGTVTKLIREKLGVA